MMPNIRRVKARNYYEAPILFADFTSGYYYDGVMKNCSMDGMHFISDFPVKPGSNIYIETMVDSTPITFVPQDYDCYDAEVKWCREITDCETLFYGIGVQFCDAIM